MFFLSGGERERERKIPLCGVWWGKGWQVLSWLWGREVKPVVSNPFPLLRDS
jgi:hypothetical protein